MDTITRPTFLVNETICRNNIQRMAAKAEKLGISLRPHFKTHQSRVIGQWFRDYGIESITVSSVRMARYFAENGWDRITIAFPLNIREIKEINDLSSRVDLDVIISDSNATGHLETFSNPVNIWIEIDTGYHRSGVSYDQTSLIEAIIIDIEKFPTLHFKGFLSHTGNTYHAKNPGEAKFIYNDALKKMINLQSEFERTNRTISISMGDTPSISLLDDPGSIQELRPGNFVFYDLMQYALGACRLQDIAVALACPVVAIYPHRTELVVYGGATHLSKEYIAPEGHKIFGLPTFISNHGWEYMNPENRVISLSQEHGILRLESRVLENFHIGDLIGILPVHSCLTANLMRGYQTLDGKNIDHLEGVGVF